MAHFDKNKAGFCLGILFGQLTLQENILLSPYGKTGLYGNTAPAGIIRYIWKDPLGEEERIWMRFLFTDMNWFKGDYKNS